MKFISLIALSFTLFFSAVNSGAQAAPVVNNVIDNDDYTFKTSAVNSRGCVKEMSQVECQVFSYTNRVREMKKLKPLKFNRNCFSLALAQSQYMVKLSNAGKPLSRSVNHDLFKERIKRFKVPGLRITENVAGGNPKKADELFKGWMGSEKHRSNILDPKVNSMAVSTLMDKQGQQFWTQCFTSN